MKSKMLLAAAALVAVIGLSPMVASAASYQGTTTGAPHYEWQYGYVGHHPHYKGHWVLVR